jgi:transposase InsO family protein
MEVDWVCKRAHLYTLLQQHPDWSVQQLADAVGCSKSMISKWKHRLTHADPGDASILFSRSRAAHRHPTRLSKEVIETIIELRLSPPEHLHRTPGPKALLYYLPRDERLQSGDFRLPRSTRTVWQILDQAGLIDRVEPVKHSPLPVQELLQEVQMDFKEITTAVADPTSPLSKQHHLLEVCNFVDAGSSRLLSAQVHEDFHAETAFDAVVTFLRTTGLPVTLTMDRDVRWVGSATQRDFPSALIQFLYCVGVQPNVLPPHHPELNCYVERSNKTYAQECLAIARPTTLEEVRAATEQFEQHYNLERPHQGRSCGNQPPAVAHPVLPIRPALPDVVDPDRWLTALDGRWYPRLVKKDGRIQVDGLSYYVKADLAGHRIMLHLNATTRCFDVFRGDQFVKSLPIKGLSGKLMPLEDYLDLMRERTRSQERQRMIRQRQARRQGEQSA